MGKMMENEILDTIQSIAYIFYRKNIVVCPFDVSYMNTIVKPEMEVITTKELIMYLNDLLIKYKKKKKEDHKFGRYLKTFLKAYDDNFDNGIIVTQKKKKIA